MMSNNSTGTLKPDGTTYPWRRTNNTFYRITKIILCISRVGFLYLEKLEYDLCGEAGKSNSGKVEQFLSLGDSPDVCGQGFYI